MAKNVGKGKVETKTASKNYVDVRFTAPKYAGIQRLSVYTLNGKEHPLLDAHGKPMQLSITPPGRRFYLDDPEQKRLWEWIKGDTTDYKNEWKGHPFLDPAAGTLTINEVVETAKRNIAERKRRRELDTKLEELATDTVALEDFARLVGIDPEKEAPDTIVERITMLIDSDTERMEQLFNDSDLEVRKVLYKGVAKKIFTENDGYYFNTTFMGLNDEQAVGWLKTNSTVLESVKQQMQETVEN